MKVYKECPTCGNTSWEFYRMVDHPFLNKKEIQLQCMICHQVCTEDDVIVEIDTGDHEKDKSWTPSPFIKIHRVVRDSSDIPMYINYNYITRIVPIDDSNGYCSLISMQNHPEWQEFRLKETVDEIIEKIKEAQK